MNQIILIRANYLYECNYNTYNELMNMSIEQINKRFDEITKGAKNE